MITTSTDAYTQLNAPNGGSAYYVTDDVRLGAEEGRLDDYFIHSAGAAFLYAGGGNDYLNSYSDEISYLFGQSGNDVLIASGGSGKLLDGGAGNDLLISEERDYAYQNTALDTLIGGTGQDKFVVGNYDNSNGLLYGDAYKRLAPKVRIVLNNGDGNDVLTGSPTTAIAAPQWDFGLPSKPTLVSQNEFTTGLVEAQAENLEVNVNASNIAFAFKALEPLDRSALLVPGDDETPAIIGRFEVTLGYGTGINTLRYVERLPGTGLTVDQINVNTGSGSFFFSGGQIRNIYQAFTAYQAQNPTVNINSLSAVRSNADLLQIIQNNSTPVTGIA